jgi:Methyltransferase domain
MLLARSVGSIGMAVPAFLVPDWRTGRQAEEQAPRMPSGPTGRRMRRAGRGLGPAGGHYPGGQTERQLRASLYPRHHLPHTRRPSRPDWRSLPVATRPRAASGCTRCSGRVAAGRLAQPSLTCIDSPRLLSCQLLTGCARHTCSDAGGSFGWRSRRAVVDAPSPVHTGRARCAPSQINNALGDACDLDLGDGAVDAVLLLGPIYHLRRRDQRLRALREAWRVVRPGGPVFVAAISRWAPRLDGELRGPPVRVVAGDPRADAEGRAHGVDATAVSGLVLKG